MINEIKAKILADADDMAPVSGTIDVDIPVKELWACFRKAHLWKHWNSCFLWVRNKDLIAGEQLVWAFQPIRKKYIYKMPAMAKIVEVIPEQKVTWQVNILPGFYALHSYTFEDLGNGRTRFGSWEKAYGWNFRGMKRFWIAHFEFVKNASLDGAKKLDSIYKSSGRLDETSLRQ